MLFPLDKPKFADGLGVRFGRHAVEYYCGVPPAHLAPPPNTDDDFNGWRMSELYEWIERERMLDAADLGMHASKPL